MLLEESAKSLIKVLGGYTLAHKAVGIRKRLTGNLTGFSHPFQLFGIFYNNHTLSNTQCGQGQTSGVSHRLLSLYRP